MTVRSGLAYAFDDTWVPDERTRCAADPDHWFSHEVTGGSAGRQRPDLAAKMCAGCPFINPCLDAAMRYERGKPASDRFGVWGGTLPRERALLDGMRVSA